jgi:phosphatidate cytidylyltransferase
VSGATALPVPETGFLSHALTMRVLSALVLAVPVLASVYFGAPAFELMVSAAALAMTWEWYRICARDAPGVAAVAAGVTILAAVTAVGLAQTAFSLALLGIGAIGVFFVSRRHFWLSAGVFYVGLPCVAIVWLRNEPTMGRETIFWLLGLVWASDIGAYAFGRLIGGPKLAPSVSPNKTWAGLFGAMICAGLVGAATAALLELEEFWRLALISTILGAAAQAGDLLESWVKRKFGVKDASSLIPGHGGFLDRADALIAAVVITALITASVEGSMLTWL